MWLGAFSASVSALALNKGPPPTPCSNHRDSYGVFAKPTAGPGLEELRRRQEAQVTQRTLIAAPDNTCGFFGGSSGTFSVS